MPAAAAPAAAPAALQTELSGMHAGGPAMVQTSPVPILSTEPDATLAPYFDAARSKPYVEEHKLRQVAANAQGTLWVTIANMGHEAMTRNMAAQFSKQQFGSKSFFVFCLCSELCDKMRAIDVASGPIPPEWLPPRLADIMRDNRLCGEQKWEAADYNALTQFKSWVVYHLLANGIDVGFTDVDIGFGRTDTLKDMQALRASGPQMLLSLDGPSTLYNEVKLNSGFYLARATPASVAFFRGVSIYQEKHKGEVDQTIFNTVFRGLGYTAVANGVTQYLNPLLYANGYIMLRTDYKSYGIKPMIFHANWLVGKVAKEKALKDAGMWLI